MRFWKQLAVALGMFVILALPLPVQGTDIPIFPTGPVFKITPALVWGTATQPGFNNNYFFTPININESVCVFVYNNNTTNPHAFTAAIQVSGDPSSSGPSTGTWQSAANSANLSAAIAPGLPAGIGASVTGASQVSINFSASSTQAGAPDTANVTIIQTQGNCFAGNQFIGSAPQTISAISPMQAISDGLSQSFTSSSFVTNPGIGANSLTLNANNGSRTLYVDSVLISCSAACSVQVITNSTAGTTCTSNGALNQKVGSTVASTAITNFSCTGAPATIGVYLTVLFIPASGNIVLDLRGMIIPSGTTNGVSIVMQAALTGTINTIFRWYEK